MPREHSTTEVESLIEKGEAGNRKNKDNVIVSSSTAPTKKKYSTKIIAFAALVVVQGAHILFFRLSQINGKYAYNTASAVAVTEAVKLFMSAGLYWAGTERKMPPLSMFFSYTFCAAAYAINNQLAMWLLLSMGTGMVSLGKSLTPMLTAMTMWSLYPDEKFVRMQGICFVILTMGLVCLFAPGQNSGNPITPLALAWMLFSIGVSTFTAVYNSRILQRGGVSMHMQNMMLYSQGFVFNIIMYVSGINATGKGASSQGFFDGYGNFFVIGVLLSQSFMGLVISAVYKYGDAIIKGLASSTQSSGLLLFDAFLFGYHFNIQSIMGAGIVMVTTYTYLTEAIPAQLKAKEEDKKNDKKGVVQASASKRDLLRYACGAFLALSYGVIVAYLVIFYAS